MGKVASDKCHKWVFKEPSESEPNLANYWQSSFDAVRSHKSFFLFWLDEEFMILMFTLHLYKLFGWSNIYCSFLQNGPTNSNQASRSTIKFCLLFFSLSKS